MLKEGSHCICLSMMLMSQFLKKTKVLSQVFLEEYLGDNFLWWF